MAHRGGSTRGGSTSDGEDAAKRCALRVNEIRVSFQIVHSRSSPMYSSSPILSSGLFVAQWILHVPDCSSFCTLGLVLTQSI